MDLSVIIPGRCEMFFSKTVEDVLSKARGDTEVIAVIDGPWPEPPIYDHPRLKIIRHTTPVGQRAATNDGVKLSRAKYIAKLDAHCSVSEGFDVAILEDMTRYRCIIPSQYNLHAFDWVCTSCGERTYQGVQPLKCAKCSCVDHKMDVVWKPRLDRLTLSWRFDKNLQFQYWRAHARRPECQGDLIETMSFIGACMFMDRERYWELGGLDEAHGSWGQFGSEISAKVWLSGGQLVTTRKAWFAHMFRTGNFAAPGRSTWPYPITQGDIDRARSYSSDLWMNNKWPGQKRPLWWLVEKFWPVDGWTEEDVKRLKEAPWPVNHGEIASNQVSQELTSSTT